MILIDYLEYYVSKTEVLSFPVIFLQIVLCRLVRLGVNTYSGGSPTVLVVGVSPALAVGVSPAPAVDVCMRVLTA